MHLLCLPLNVEILVSELLTQADKQQMSGQLFSAAMWPNEALIAAAEVCDSVRTEK